MLYFPILSSFAPTKDPQPLSKGESSSRIKKKETSQGDMEKLTQ